MQTWWKWFHQNGLDETKTWALKSPDLELRVKRYGGLKLKDLSVKFFQQTGPWRKNWTCLWAEYVFRTGKSILSRSAQGIRFLTWKAYSLGVMDWAKTWQSFLIWSYVDAAKRSYQMDLPNWYLFHKHQIWLETLEKSKKILATWNEPKLVGDRLYGEEKA